MTLSRLFETRVLDTKDGLDASWEKAHEELCLVTQGVSAEDAQLRLLEKAAGSRTRRDVFVVGLLYTILVDPSQAPRAWADLAAIGRSDHTVLVRNVGYLAQAKFPRLRHECKAQLLWIIEQLIDARIDGMHGVFVCALRQLSCNTSAKPRNTLLRQLLKIISAHSGWLCEQHECLQACAHVLMRLVGDHHHTPTLHPLRDAEAELALFFLRRNFEACTAIGRDIVRALRDVANAPGFPDLWSTIYTAPSSLHPSFRDIASVLFSRTTRRILAMRLPPVMEAELMFILKELHTTNATKHMQWFVQRHLSGADSEPLTADVIRFVCCNHHPTNKVLASPIVKRYEVLLQLLFASRSNIGGQHAKLALFYDLLFFQRGDNIMNVEPGILLLKHTAQKTPAVWATLLEFLILMAQQFHPPIAARITACITRAFQEALRLGVIGSMRDIVPTGCEQRLRDAFTSTFPHISPAVAAERMAQESARTLAREVYEADDEEALVGAKHGGIGAQMPTASTGQGALKGIRAADEPSTATAKRAARKPQENTDEGDTGTGGAAADSDDDDDDDEMEEEEYDIAAPPHSPIGRRGSDQTDEADALDVGTHDDSGSGGGGGGVSDGRSEGRINHARRVGTANESEVGQVSGAMRGVMAAAPTTSSTTTTTMGEAVAATDHFALEEEVEGAYDPASAGRVRFSTGRLVFFDGLIEKFAVNTSPSFYEQLFQRVMQRLESVAAKPAKEPDSVFISGLASALMPPVMLCLDNAHDSQQQQQQRERKTGDGDGMDRKTGDDKEGNKEDKQALSTWPVLTPLRIPSPPHHILIRRAIQAKGRFEDLCAMLLSALAERDERVSLHVLLVTLQERMSAQSPTTDGIKLYCKMHGAPDIRRATKPVLRDISLAARELPSLVDCLCLHALKAMGGAAVSCNAPLAAYMCARLSPRGWNALQHGIACIALPKMLTGEGPEEEQEGEGGAATEQVVRSDFPAMSPPSVSLRTQRRVRRIWRVLAAAAGTVLPEENAACHRGENIHQRQQADSGGGDAVESPSPATMATRHRQQDDGVGGAVVAAAAMQQPLEASPSPPVQIPTEADRAIAALVARRSDVVRLRLVQLALLELTTADLQIQLEFVRQTPLAVASTYPTIITNLLMRSAPDKDTLRLALAFQSRGPSIAATTVAVWAQQHMQDLCEAMRGLLSDVDSDMRSGDVDAGDGGHDGRGDEERQQQRQQQEKRGGEEPRALAVLCELNEFCKETTKGKNIISGVRGALVKDLAVRETLVRIFTRAPPQLRISYSALLSLSGAASSSLSS